MRDFVKLLVVAGFFGVIFIFLISSCGYIDRNNNQGDEADFATLFEVHEILKTEHRIYPEIVNLFAKKEISVKKNKVFIKNEKKLNLFIKNI